MEQIINKELIRKRFETGFARYHRAALVQQEICTELATMLDGIELQEVKRAFEVGTGTGFLTSLLVPRVPHAEWFLNDLSQASESFIDGILKGTESHYLWGDAEIITFPGNLDLIATASTVQWFENLTGFILHAAASTNPGGWLLISGFAPLNFTEIRQLTGIGLEYPEAEEFYSLITAAGYDIIRRKEEIREVLFDSPADVLKHISTTAVNSIRSGTWGKSRYAEFTADYRRLFDRGEGRVCLTYAPVMVLARKK